MWNENNTIDDLAKGVLLHGPEILAHCQTSEDLSLYTDRLFKEKLNYPVPSDCLNTDCWFLPSKYQNFDIENFVKSLCQNQEELSRVVTELDLYKNRDMIPVLKCMKYVVDTLRENNIVWGVGRGSSVASYVLFLLGVHKIDSLKYDLPIEEFFKGEHNG